MENKTAFMEGFLRKKRRARSAAEDDFSTRRDKVEAAGAATGLVAAGGMRVGSLTDKKLTSKEGKKLVEDLSRHFQMSQPKIRQVYNQFDAYYNPSNHSVGVTSEPLQGILSHELGHASHASLHEGALKSVRKHVSKLAPASRILYGAPALALLSGNETVRDAALPASLLLGLPVLAEEATASAQALRGLHKTRGFKSALKAVPGLLGAYTTYASVPVGIWAANKWITGKKEKQ